MRRLFFAIFALVSAAPVFSQEYNPIPSKWKWTDLSTVVFTYDSSYTDSACFSIHVPGRYIRRGVSAPGRYDGFPVHPVGAENMLYSPDSTKIAFTRGNDLFVVDPVTAEETRLTFDGNDLILNGYASWVYYEEIFGRTSDYRAFWWAPDSKKLAFYRFDDSDVPMFPIYSPSGQDGRLIQTRYPKAGERNPEVRVGIIDFDYPDRIVWAEFDWNPDQYFGTPFWGADSRELYVQREPRVQNTLDLYAVNASDGSLRHVYHEYYPTWLSFLSGMLFTDDGLYMARSFETGWEQVYYLSYDGKTLKRLTDGPNFGISLLRADGRTGKIYFTATRDNSARRCLYSVDGEGNVVALTDPSLDVKDVSFSGDCKYFVASLSNSSTPTQVWLYETAFAPQAWKGRRIVPSAVFGRHHENRSARSCMLVADRRGPDFNPGEYAFPKLEYMTVEGGLVIPAMVTYPKDFDTLSVYPVHFEVYGGPENKYVRDRWREPDDAGQWWSRNGIIHVVADSRVAGHNGRAGTDLSWRNLTAAPIEDFVAWADHFAARPYVDGSKIGVEGFSFGGTMASLLLLEHSDRFVCGIAGGGVYDWLLYDSNYTERFMDLPSNNPTGYAESCILNHTESYPVSFGSDSPVMLKLTHGTGDDNVHFQNTLQLVNKLQKEGKNFELMIYPDGKHGYRDAQKTHSTALDQDFWTRYLLR